MSGECSLAELTEKVVDIIKAHQTIDSESSGEIELDFESLSDSTMRELEAFFQKEQSPREVESSAPAVETAAPLEPEPETESTAPVSTSIAIHEATPPHAPASRQHSRSTSSKEPDSPPSQPALEIASYTTPTKPGAFYSLLQ